MEQHTESSTPPGRATSHVSCSVPILPDSGLAPELPSPPPPRRRRWLAPAAAVAALAIGLGVGTQVGNAAPQEAPQATVITATTTVEVTPESCLTALKNANEVMAVARQGFGITARGMRAAGNLDLSGMQRMIDDLDALTPVMTAARFSFDSAAEECRREATR